MAMREELAGGRFRCYSKQSKARGGWPQERESDMLKRIAIVGDAELVRSANEANDNPQIFFTTMDDTARPAPGACAVLAPSGHSRQAVKAAAAVAEEHAAALNLIADAVAAREGIPLGDSMRVLEHASRFARVLQLSPEDTTCLERASLLRDIGKIRIPNDILLKKSVLDFDEWTLLKGHSRLGAELLLERGVSIDIVQIVEFHHECYDGDGYPDHLERAEIPFLARVMRILDVYCAMTSPRQYRKSTYSVKEAVEYLKAERSKHFDPELVDAFVAGNVAQEDK